METKKKKKFSETKVGQLLGGLAGKVLPDSGVLGIVKNLIDTDEELTPDQKEEAHRQMKELHALQVEDRKSAREREVGMAKAGKHDILFNLTGVVGLLSFVFVIYAIVYEPQTKDNELFIHLLGLLEGVVVSNLFAYFFGTSVDKEK
jgi:hypothetical protein